MSQIQMTCLFLLLCCPAGIVFSQEIDAAAQRELGNHDADKMKTESSSSRRVTLVDGYFQYDNGTRYFPFGSFSNYFKDELANEQQGGISQHGEQLLEFQRMPVSVWRRFLQNLKKQGYTAIRMFPRGDSSGSAWEGLDIGGRVNHTLLRTMFRYFEIAAEYGIKVQLCLFTQMECSFYCQPDTRRYWGASLYSPEEIAAAPAHQRRFLQNLDDLVTYNDYYSDADVIACNKQFLDEIIPLIKNNPNIFMVELSNELGWASPNANPPNTFRWEITKQYLSWTREMVKHIHRIAPDLPVCLSNPGVGLLGHDPVQWGRETGIDLFSMHLYPDSCGNAPGTDYAQIIDISLRYTQLSCPVMYGEWKLLGAEDVQLPVGKTGNMSRKRYEQLLARDVIWFTMLSGAPGCITWAADDSYGEYRLAHKLFESLNGRDLSRDASDLKINIGYMIDKMITVAENGNKSCQFKEARWCPDHLATDGLHRFCVKAESDEYKSLLNIETWSLETGVDFTLTSTNDGIPLSEVSRKTFLKYPVPLKIPDGYQMKLLYASNRRTILIYLRNYQRESVMKTNGQSTFELFALRSQKPVPLTLHFVTDTPYEMKLLDLDTREQMIPQTIDKNSIVDLGVTSHDYVLVLTQ
ncbi:MAG: hypothetical protein LBQ50_04740 [Planctomycetaceae bacterium]|jgi:hypothetical protein|nr:hypothetical protein [Planctomycetaceae bacterium]